MYSPTESEFEAFPPAVKRKCFSTLERLRIAQAALPNQPSTQLITKARNHPRLSKSTFRCQFLRKPSDRPSRRTLRRSDVSPEDALWFLSLPDKVRRNNFSAEERTILAGRLDCESVILDATDEALYKLGQQANRSLPSLQESYSSQSSARSIDLEDWVESEDEMDDKMMESFRWMDEDLDLSLDDYHVHIAETAQAPIKRSLSFNQSTAPRLRRNRSLSSVRRPSVDSTHPPILQSSMKGQHTPKASASSQQARPAVQAPTYNADPTALHINDPEARLKLRLYLASPQKFDEAVEFGFPSLQNVSRPSSRRPSLSHNHTRPLIDPHASTFWDDDGPAVFDHDEAPRARDIPTPDSLATSLREAMRPRASRPSVDSVRPHFLQASSEPYAHAWPGNREMTLRMTLTRPDLRADESILYPNSRPNQQDPFALADLPVTDDGDAWTRGAKENNRSKKFWQKVGRKSTDSWDGKPFTLEPPKITVESRISVRSAGAESQDQLSQTGEKKSDVATVTRRMTVAKEYAKEYERRRVLPWEGGSMELSLPRHRAKVESGW